MNQFNRTEKFEEHILKNVGGFVYLDCCRLGIDPINIYLARKELEKEGKQVICIVGTNTQFGYLVSFILKDIELPEHVLTVEDALDKPVFAYVYNATYTDCSEYGYVQITRDGNKLTRVY